MANYSFSTTTVGDILDNETLFNMFIELAPEAIGHPMLEIGRPFTIEQALPFIEAIAADMGVENVPEKIEEFKAKLEAFEG